MSEKCGVCKLDLHPAMADRYSGYCSQGCEAIAEVGEQDAKIQSLRSLLGKAVEVLEELRVLVKDIRSGDYKPDSLTMQPTEDLLAKIKERGE